MLMIFIQAHLVIGTIDPIISMLKYAFNMDKNYYKCL